MCRAAATESASSPWREAQSACRVSSASAMPSAKANAMSRARASRASRFAASDSSNAAAFCAARARCIDAGRERLGHLRCERCLCVEQGLRAARGAQCAHEIECKHVRRAFPDREDLRVAQQLRHAAVLEIAGAAEAFAGFRHDGDRELSGPRFDQGCEQAQFVLLRGAGDAVLGASEQFDRMKDEMKRGLELRVAAGPACRGAAVARPGFCRTRRGVARSRARARAHDASSRARRPRSRCA